MKDQADFQRFFGGGKSSPRSFAVLRKEGRSFLYLPSDKRMADTTLRLYPAQSLFARSLMTLIRGFMRVGLPISRETVSFPVDENAAFPEFLKRLVPGNKTVPNFGIFANRNNEAGRPYILVLFDDASRPRAVVKMGASRQARQLIRGEQDLFFPESPHFPGLPEALDRYEDEEVSAIAYRYVEGSTPTPEQHGEIDSILNSWVQDDISVRLPDLSVWARLKTLLKDNPALHAVFEILQEQPIKPVLYHGDFAPWNIRVSSSAAACQWVVLDWERGARRGVPGWDWFNFFVQYSIWVRGLTPEATLEKIEALWQTPGFQLYSRRTGIETILRELTFAYLLYFLHFCNPRVKTAGIRVLVREFNKKYFPKIVLPAPPLKVSVVTPSYKQLPWLKLCAASVADQKGVAVEHIIQDAQSGPELDAWVRQNTKAQLFVECDSGMYDAINRGFARATGDIVCWLNSDEQYLEGSLAKVAHFFETHPEIDVLFGDALLVSNTGTLLSYRRTIQPSVRHIKAAHLNTLSCATFVRRSVIERGFTLNTRWKAIADAVWVVDLLQAGVPTAVLNEPLAAFTITDSNLGQTSLALSEGKLWQEKTSLIDRLLRPYFVVMHRLAKLLNGAYSPRSVSTRLYTLASPETRVRQDVARIGFGWPRVD